MGNRRRSGIILHPTSLPGPDGMGDLGPEAYRWVTFLADAGCTFWQILPLGPTGYGDSPYQCFSAFAGNPYLVNPSLLQEDNLLTRADLVDRPVFPEDHVDYGEAIHWKNIILDRACTRFERNAPKGRIVEFEEFQASQSHWLDDFTLFMAIKEAQGGVSWNNWPAGLRQRDAKAIEKFRASHAEAIQRQSLRQFFFHHQWRNLLQFAHQKGVQIVGDIPIFVAYDSADAWSHPELFFMNKKGLPTVVAGVPPDYFSPTGQLWGNPLYRWEVHRQSGYDWWLQRLKATLEVVDIIRLDHFRGFAGYWEIPFGKPTAEIGRWVGGPGAVFFEAVQSVLGSLPIIAEDLGEITPDVVELRERFNLPGMKILQFAFSGDPDEPFLPHNYPENCVAYTGTHDNDTSIGWYAKAPQVEQDFCRRYLARSGEDIAWDFIRAVWSSVARMAGAPMQDFLSLGSEARMNHPGKASGNWMWRMPAGALTAGLMERIYEMNNLYGRLPGEGKKNRAKKAGKKLRK